MRDSTPGSTAVERLLIGVTAILSIVAMAMAVITA
jgi:hypothetical protein